MIGNGSINITLTSMEINMYTVYLLLGSIVAAVIIYALIKLHEDDSGQ